MLFARKITAITPTQAWEAQRRKDIVLVDVRQPQEQRSDVVAGALLIPLNELARRMDELPRGRTVAFLCRSGHRSTLAARQARRHGIDVASIKGGMIAWKRAGLPTSTPPRHANHPA